MSVHFNQLPNTILMIRVTTYCRSTDINDVYATWMGFKVLLSGLADFGYSGMKSSRFVSVCEHNNVRSVKSKSISIWRTMLMLLSCTTPAGQRFNMDTKYALDDSGGSKPGTTSC
ncbi:hypothetical protein KC19_VG234200 [Ceratodon purpureus]|uniref:Uncharacterized protein n=1 Tax=Ceratodon purpureus TaxID=3225 RepID=A0A8T0HTK9_CERPU|nr:hypothetical protein KC19_VG234200 [Ceratodon purpureus]